ncbi:hypothetical protein GCM10023220_47290 [Streptomyces ziwulingensis]|uniref:Uncharacterized protein n=1 Tax=Streptomyces ziwulingensis TaxID=1045501 RepID=A0ABP9CGX0_9ACTN
MTLETAARDTPAARATSRMVTARRRPLTCDTKPPARSFRCPAASRNSRFERKGGAADRVIGASSGHLL